MSRLSLRRTARARTGRPESTNALPAGVDPEGRARSAAPGFRERGRLRRRLRYLRRARQLALRDLGGLVLELHRADRRRDDLVQEKLGAIEAIDGELGALETALDDARPVHELREAGIAACPGCGSPHPSDARFCSACGMPLGGGAPAAAAAGRAEPAPAAEPPPAGKRAGA